MQTQYSNYNRLHLSAPQLEHMTRVAKPLRLNKAQGKGETTQASNYL